MATTEVEITDLMLQKDARRGIVNRELMVFYGYNVERYLPPLPSTERPKSSLVCAWECKDQAIRQLSNIRRRGPRMTFPGVLTPRPNTAREFHDRDDPPRPHTSSSCDHIKMVLNTKISDVFSQRPATSYGKIERMPYHKLGPVDNMEGLIVPRRLQSESDHPDGVSDLASVISIVGAGLRRPKAGNMNNRRKKGRKGKGGGMVLSSLRKEDIMRVIKGDTENAPKNIPTKIKIYLCTPPMDMEVEKRYLYEHAFPDLRQFCQRHGLDFQVVDIPVETDLDNQTKFNYKISQLQRCQDESLGPFCVILMGDRYGISLLPDTLTEKEFYSIDKVAEEHLMENRELIRKCYNLDENKEPPNYKLQIDDLSQNEFFKLEKVVKDAIKLCVQMSRVPVELGETVRRSVMDHEIYKSIPRSKGTSPNCLCFHRCYKGLIEHIKSKAMPKVLDLLRIKGVLKPMPDTTKQTQLKDLLSYITSHIGEDNIKSYSVIWQGDGIEEEKYEDHSIYLENLSHDFVQGVKRLIEQNRPQWEVKSKHLPLYKEVAHHAKITSQYTQRSVCVEGVLQTIYEHLKDKEKSSVPLLISSPLGQGKSCLLANILKGAKRELGEKSVSIIRYLGSSPQSTYLHEMLQFLCEQISAIYNIDSLSLNDLVNTDRLSHAFMNYLEVVGRHHSSKRPLLIVLDSLHQLSSRYRAHTFFWLPAKLPPNIHVIASVDSSSELLDVLTTKFGPALEMSPFDKEKSKELFRQIMNERKKHLSEQQMGVIHHILDACHDPVFTQWLTMEATNWTSQMEITVDSLPSNMEEFLRKQFSALESEFGENFTKSAIQLLSILKHGISEVELRDAMSLNEAVYVDVMKNAESRKNEHSLLKSYSQLLDTEVHKFLYRIKDFVVTCRIHEKNLLQWKFDHFKTIVSTSYFDQYDYEDCKIEEFKRLTDVFAQQDGICQKFNGKSVNCGVTPQYLFPTNSRKLHIFGEIAIQSDTEDNVVGVVKSQLLCNFNWLLTKLEGTSYRGLWGDFKTTTRHDHEIDIMRQVIKCARPGFRGNIQCLGPQILGSLPYLDSQQYQAIHQVVKDAQKWIEKMVDPVLVPLLQCFPSAIDLCQSRIWSITELIHLDCGVMGVVKNKDGLIEIWDMHSEDHAFSLGLQFDKSTPNVFCAKNRVLGIDGQMVRIWEIESGVELFSIDMNEILGSPVSTLFSLCHFNGLELIALYISDDDFNQSVAVMNTKERRIVSTISSFDVKDEFYMGGGIMLQGGKSLAFINSRKETVDDTVTELTNFSIYKVEDGSLVTTVDCNQKKFNKLFAKDDTHMILSWMDCSYDIYHSSDGSHIQHLSSPEPNLNLQACEITPDGYLVVLASTPLDQSRPHMGLWFWNLDDLVSAELLIQPLVSEEAIPRYFQILEELHMVVLAIPDQGKLSIWDLPTSTLVHTLNAHSSGLNGVVKSSEDPYVIYTSSHVEKVVKMWNIYSVVHKADRKDEKLGSIEDDEDVSELTSHDGILKSSRPMSRDNRPKSVRFADDITKETKEDNKQAEDKKIESPKADDSQCEIESPDCETLSSFGPRDKKSMAAQSSCMMEVSSFVLTKDGKQVVCGSAKKPPVVWNCFDGSVNMRLKAHLGYEQATPQVMLALNDTTIVGFVVASKDPPEDWPTLYKYRVWRKDNGNALYKDDEEIVLSAGQISVDGCKAVLITPLRVDLLQNDTNTELQVTILDVKENQVLSTLPFETYGIPTRLDITDDLHYGVAMAPTNRPKVGILNVLGLEMDKSKEPASAAYQYQIGTKYKSYGATANCVLTNSLSIAVGMNGDLQMWDITTRKYEGNFYHDPGEKDTANPSLHNHNGRALNHVIVSDDRRFLVCGGADGVASVWDLGNEILMFNLKGHVGQVSRVAMSQDAQLILTGGEDMMLNVWQFNVTDRPLCRLFVHVVPTSLEISWDKQTAVVIGGNRDGSSRLQMYRLKNIREAS